MGSLSKHPVRQFAALVGLVAFAALLAQSPHQGASAASTQFTVYGDRLASGWTDWSWDSTVNLAATSPVASGSDAIAWTATRAWGGLYLHTDLPVALAPYSALNFALRATRPGQAVSVVLQDVNDSPLGPVVKLAT